MPPQRLPACLPASQLACLPASACLPDSLHAACTCELSEQHHSEQHSESCHYSTAPAAHHHQAHQRLSAPMAKPRRDSRLPPRPTACSKLSKASCCWLREPEAWPPTLPLVRAPLSPAVSKHFWARSPAAGHDHLSSSRSSSSAKVSSSIIKYHQVSSGTISCGHVV